MRMLQKTLMTALLLAGFAAPAGAGIVTIDFDAVTVGPTGSGDATSYLAGFGISLSQTAPPAPPAILAAVDDRYIYTGWGGPPEPEPALYIQAPSPHNIFTQFGNNGPITFTLHFASPLSSLAFKSVGIGPRPQATSFPAWAAEAYDATDSLLDSVFQGFGVNRATSEFTLNAPGFLIDHVTFFRDGTRGTAPTNFTAFSHVLLDDLVLTQAAVPEPATLALMLIGLVAVGSGRRLR